MMPEREKPKLQTAEFRKTTCTLFTQEEAHTTRERKPCTCGMARLLFLPGHYCHHCNR
jgi:hypothetical protein